MLCGGAPCPRWLFGTGPNWLDPHNGMRVPDLPELYIGGEGARFPVLHYDGLHTHAFLMQIQGVKEYIAFAPDQTPYTYSRSGPGQPNISEINDIENWDTNRFALFGNAKGIRFTLHPGETLFIRPAGGTPRVYFRLPSPSRSTVPMPRIGPTFARISAVTTWRAQAAPVVLQCLPSLCRQVACLVRALLVWRFGNSLRFIGECVKRCAGGSVIP
jgi:cupin-like protein